jgi:hypothetical protein
LREAIEEWNASNAETDQRGAPIPAGADPAEQPPAESAGDAADADYASPPADSAASDGSDNTAAVAPLPAAAVAALMKEEEQVRARIVAVEDRIGELLRQPLGPDGLGQRQVRP